VSKLERFILYSVAVVVWSQIVMKQAEQTGADEVIHLAVLILLAAGWLRSFSALFRAAWQFLKEVREPKSHPTLPNTR
jgi:hypothetical protein